MTDVLRAIASVLLLGLATGCARFGFTDRVLLHVPSPDGQIVAVCQQIPALDGPGFAVRLERPNGTVLQPLYEIGDGDPCSEIAWSPDGRTLAVLSAHVARLRFVDVDWALRHPAIATRHWSWRMVDYSTEKRFMLGGGIRFTAAMKVELQLCPYALDAVRRTGVLKCSGPSVTEVLNIPQPIVTGHPIQRTGR
jgi:hypothetical protein